MYANITVAKKSLFLIKDIRCCVRLFLYSHILYSTYLMAAPPPSIEVLHWWTSGGEVKALNVIKDQVAQKGVIWHDSTIKGAEEQKRVLQARIHETIPPDAILTQYIPTLAKNHFLESLDDIAETYKFNTIFPTVLQQRMKYQNHWMAVPVNIQKFNTIWANKKIFDELHLTPPKTFSELIDISQKIKDKGYIPIALGGQAWQEAIILESVLLSLGNSHLFQKALIEYDIETFKSKEMLSVFEKIILLRPFFDKDAKGRDWNLATSMLIHNKAAMQVMGSWAKGQFTIAKQIPNKDFLCFPFPGTSDFFVFSSDFFGIIKSKQQKNYAPQKIFIESLIDKKVQEEFNLLKGSIPAREDIKLDHYDSCAQQEKTSLLHAIQKNAVVEHMEIHLNEAQRPPLYEAIDSLFHDPNITAIEAQKKFINAIKILKNK